MNTEKGFPGSDLRKPSRCRDGRIRTDDPLTPSQVRYQAAPRPDAPARSPPRQPVQLSAAIFAPSAHGPSRVATRDRRTPPKAS